MTAKTGLVIIVIVLGFMPCLFGNDKDVASTKTNYLPSLPVKSDGRITADIERPLLRPVVYRKEEQVQKPGNQKVEGTPSEPKKEEGVESLLSLLRTEREKLQELEQQYNTIGNNGYPGQNSAGVNREGVNTMTEPTSVSQVAQSSQPDSIQMNSGTSTEIPGGDAATEVSAGKGGAAPQLSVMKNNKKSETALSSATNKRLEMIARQVSQLDIAECYYKLCEYGEALQTYKLLTPANTSLDQYVWAQYQIANCYRNMKKYDSAFGEYQRFVNQFPESALADQAKWYMDDVTWWKGWQEKNTSAGDQLLTASNNHISR